MATNEVGVRIVTTNEGTGFRAFIGEVETAADALGDVERKSKIDGQLSLDLDDVDRAEKALDDLDAETIDTKVNVDDSEIVRTADELNDLGVKPKPIKFEADAVDVTSGIEAALASVDTASAGNSIVQGISTKLGAAAGPIAAAAAGLVTIFGDEFVDGFDRGFNARKNTIELAIKSGLSDIQLRDVGAAAGEAWAGGFGEGMGELKNAAALLQVELSAIGSNFDLGDATKQAQLLADVWGIEIPESTRLAQRLIGTEMVQTHNQAMDLIIDSAQRFPAHYEEILGVLDEFAPVFGKFGVEGSAAVNLVGESLRTGLNTNADRAAELLEELNIELTDGMGRARPVLQELGVDFEEMQEKMATGRGKEALVEIVTALQNVASETERNQLMFDLFGASNESAFDPGKVLEYLEAVTQAGDAIEGTAKEAVEMAEESQTAFERLKRSVSDFGEFIGKGLNKELEIFYDFGDFLQTTLPDALGAANFSELTSEIEALIGKVVNLKDGFLELIGVSEGETVELENLTDRLREGEEGFQRIAGAVPSYVSEAMEAADATSELVSETESLSDALDKLAGQYDSSRILRSIQEDAEDLISAAKELETDIYDLNTGFDRSTEAGRQMEAMLEAQHENVLDLAQAYLDNNASAGELARGQELAEASIRAVAAQMQLTEAETQALIDQYTQVPDEVNTNAELNDNATSRILEVEERLNRLDGKTATTHIENRIRQVNTYETYYYTGRGRIPQSAHGGIIGSSGGSNGMIPLATAQSGGLRSNQVLVGEEGPEIVDLPPGAMVHSNPDSERMLMQSNRGGDVHIHLHVAGSILAERQVEEIVADGLRRGGYDDLVARIR